MKTKLKTYYRLYEELVAPIADHVMDEKIQSTAHLDAEITVYVVQSELVLKFEFVGAEVTILLMHDLNGGTIFAETYLLDSPGSIKEARKEFYQSIMDFLDIHQEILRKELVSTAKFHATLRKYSS